MRCAAAGLDLRPERQVVAVVVAVVVVAALLDDEPPRVRAVAAGVPAERPLAAGELPDQARGLVDVTALGRFRQVLVVDPAQAVAGDLVVPGHEGLDELWIAPQRHADAEDGERELAALELAQDAP